MGSDAVAVLHDSTNSVKALKEEQD